MIGEIKFQQARDFRSGRRDPSTGETCNVRCVVIHTAEIGESLEGAEALMNVCAKGQNYPPGHPKAGEKRLASWHYAVDADSVTQSVKEEDTAFHAPGLSHCSVGIEHSGRARQTAEEWDDHFSRRMLELSAELVAGICARQGIPCVRIGVDEVRTGHAGICGHVEVSKAFGKSDHWDPGGAFPWDWYLERVLHYSRLIHVDPNDEQDPDDFPPEELPTRDDPPRGNA